MTTFNQNTKYYTTTDVWGKSVTSNNQLFPKPAKHNQGGFYQPEPTILFGGQNNWNGVEKPFFFGISKLSNSTLTKPTQLFGSTNLASTKPTQLFGSTNLASTKPTQLFGSTNLASTKPTQLFGSTNSTLTKPTQLFGSTNSTLTKPFTQQTVDFDSLYDVASNLTLKPLNLPKNKIEGLIYMVCMDQKNSLLNIRTLLNNVFDTTNKFSNENLWFTALIKYSDEKFTMLYSSLLRELMVENIQTPEQLYEWLIVFAKESENKKMVWLFTLLKYAGQNKICDILDTTNELEMFALSLQTFIQFDNNPNQTIETALQSTNSLYKTFLLSMVGASYGKLNLTTELSDSTTELSDLASSFK
jgi:hypothetical protein